MNSGNSFLGLGNLFVCFLIVVCKLIAGFGFQQVYVVKDILCSLLWGVSEDKFGASMPLTELIRMLKGKPEVSQGASTSIYPSSRSVNLNLYVFGILNYYLSLSIVLTFVIYGGN